MDNSIAPFPVGKRGRNSSVILTDRLCEKRVAKRTKVYDRKCPGLYVSITTAGVATFSFKFTDRQTGKQRTGWLGVYNPETFTVEDARSTVYGLRAKGGDALTETFRDQKATKARRGNTVAEIIEERIAWMKTPVRKPDGEMRPRLEAWKTRRAICAGFSVRGLVKHSRVTSPSMTSRRCRTTSTRGSSASPPSATHVICARPPRGSSTGRLKRGEIM